MGSDQIDTSNRSRPFRFGKLPRTEDDDCEDEASGEGEMSRDCDEDVLELPEVMGSDPVP